MICRRPNCRRELTDDLIRSGMAYCSRDCAPLGRFGTVDEPRLARAKSGPKAGMAPLGERLRQLKEAGLSRRDVADQLGVSLGTVSNYSSRYGIQFDPR